MKLRTYAALAALLALPGTALCEVTPTLATLAHQWNMNGGAQNDARNVVLANLADSTTYALAAQPDTCRPISATIVDANSSVTAGILTVAYKDCLDYPITWTLDFSVVGNRGSAVRAIGYASAITSVVTNALTGEAAGADQVKVGDAAAPGLGWAMYGRLAAPGPNGEHGVDAFGSYPVTLPITTTGASSTTVTSVSSNGAFTNVIVGDMLLIRLVPGGYTYERRVTARASANSITVHAPITIPADGVVFSYRRFFYSSNPADELVVPVTGYTTAMFTWSVEANTTVGGVVTQLECTRRGPSWPTATWIVMQQPVNSVANGATQGGIAESLSLNLIPFTACRMGFKFGTSDDVGDVGPESISYGVTLLAQ